MDDTELGLGIRVDGLYGFREALQAIDRCNQDIFYPSVLQIRQDIQPVTSPFTLGDIKAQQLLLAFDCQSQNGIDGLRDEASVFFDFVVNGIEPDKRINRL